MRHAAVATLLALASAGVFAVGQSMGANPSTGGGEGEVVVHEHIHLAADSGGDAGTTALTSTRALVNLSLLEVADTGGDFTVNANEICYDAPGVFTAEIAFTFSFFRSTGSGTDVEKFQVGKDTTGAIGNGDELGDEFHRSVSTSAAAGMGVVTATTVLLQFDCVGLLGFTDSDNTITVQAAHVAIHGQLGL